MVFAKAPEPGRVKTRLLLPPETAAALHAAFVRDVVARHQRPGRRVTVWRAGAQDHPLWAGLDARLANQVGADLGERMAHAFAAELEGDARVVIIGTDSPTLPPRLVDEAFALLDEVPVVVGPACDGGYYLLGARGAVPPCFEGLAWGGDQVLLDTLDALAELPHRLLDFWYDVDRPADLALLRRHLRALPPTERPKRTEQILETLR